MAGTSGEEVIEIRVRRIDQLFSSLDPSPFHERDLDPAAAAHVLDWARVLPGEAPLAIRIHLGDPAPVDAGGVASAIATYFAYHADTMGRDLRELLAMGWVYLAIGVSALALSVLGGQVALALLAAPFSQMLREGLAILGWVAMWKPVQTFLYDWVPLRRRRRLLRRLAAARVELVNSP